MEMKQIDAIEDADAFWANVVDPSTEKLIMRLLLAGPAHPHTRALKRKEERKLSHAVERAGDLQRAYKQRVLANLRDEDAALEEMIAALMARTLDWDGVLADGVVAPFDAKIMEGWYRGKEWIRDQVTQEFGRRENFTKSSAPS